MMENWTYKLLVYPWKLQASGCCCDAHCTEFNSIWGSWVN